MVKGVYAMTEINLEPPCSQATGQPCSNLSDVQNELRRLKKLARGNPDNLANLRVMVLEVMDKHNYKKEWKRLAREMFTKKSMKPGLDESPTQSLKINKCQFPQTPGGLMQQQEIAGNFEKLRAQLRTYLLVADEDALDIVLGAAATHDWEGDNPNWMLIVGPPSGAKTEYIEVLDCHPKVHQLSMVTPNTFLSGLSPKDAVGGEDPSLLKKYPRHIFTWKDLTTLLTEKYETRLKTFGRMTEVFDGRMYPHFGTGKAEPWEGFVSMIMGVTPLIYQQDAILSLLGPRFLFLVLRQPPDIDQAKFALRRSKAENRQNKDTMVHMVGQFFATLPVYEPGLSPEWEDWFANLGTIVARVRSAPRRHKGEDGEIILSEEHEKPARVTQQLAKLAKGIARVHGLSEVGKAEMDMVRRVAFDTIPPVRSHILLTLFKRNGSSPGHIADGSVFRQGYVEQALQEMRAVGAVESESKGDTWNLTEEVRQQMEQIWTEG
jgi:hypothetical protein